MRNFSIAGAAGINHELGFQRLTFWFINDSKPRRRPFSSKCLSCSSQRPLNPHRKLVLSSHRFFSSCHCRLVFAVATSILRFVFGALKPSQKSFVIASELGKRFRTGNSFDSFFIASQLHTRCGPDGELLFELYSWCTLRPAMKAKGMLTKH